MKATVNPAIHRAVRNWNDELTHMRQDYEASKETRFIERPQGMHSHGSGGDYSFRDETSYYYLLGVARNFEENDPVVPQGVTRAVDNIVQQGFQLEPKTGSDRIDGLLKERWEAYADDDNQANVDLDEEYCWHELELMTTRRIIFDGDMLVVPMQTGQLQFYEAHRMRSPTFGVRADRPRIVLGVEFSGSTNRKRSRYWVTREEFDGFGRFRFKNTEMRAVNAREFDNVTGQQEQNAFHLYMPKRFSLSRGVTALAPVANVVGMHSDIQFAKLVQQQMVSFVGFVHEIPQTAVDYEPPAPESEVLDPHTGRARMFGPDMSPGSEYWPEEPGEVIKPFSADIPNPEFFDQAKMILTFIAVNLDLPLILFLLDASETNFSGWRGSLDQAKMGFKKFQRELATKLHRPVYRFQVRRWIRQDRGLRSALASLGPDLFKHDWIYPRWPYVEPLKDVQADANEIASLLNSPSGVLARRGLRWEKVVAESVRDLSLGVDLAFQAAELLNKKHASVIAKEPGERVRWRELLFPSELSGQMQMIDPETTSAQKEVNKQRQEQGKNNGTKARTGS